MQFIDSRQINRIFEDQGQKRWAIAATSSGERIAKLKRLRKALVKRKEEFFDAIWKDFHKSRFEAWTTELLPAIEEIDYATRHLKKWMKDKPAKRTLILPTTRSYSRFEPKGRVLIMAPWNYPLLLCVSPIVSAIAAGNVIIAKPSNKTPNVSAFLASLFESLFERDEIAIIEASGPIAGDILLRLPFDHVFFTGSPEVGAHVGEMSQKIHAGLTLELGGKSPAIVLDDADIKDAAPKIAWGKLINAGQTCIAPDYVLCASNKVDSLANEIANSIKAMYGETEEDRKKNKDFARIIDKRATEKLQDLIYDAVGKGAAVAIGGKCVIGERYVAPTVLKDVTLQMKVMSGEIFGPILPILAYNSPEEAIHYVQDNPKPLALYIFGKSPKAIRSIIAQTTAGSTCVNNCIIQIENLSVPFGGVGNSGIGNYHGFYGFKTFSHERNVMKQWGFDVIRFFRAPYGKAGAQAVIQKALRFIKKM
jgi:aldehyde dehydrogenase (NAD+)